MPFNLCSATRPVHKTLVPSCTSVLQCFQAHVPNGTSVWSFAITLIYQIRHPAETTAIINFSGFKFCFFHLRVELGSLLRSVNFNARGQISRVSMTMTYENGPGASRFKNFTRLSGVGGSTLIFRKHPLFVLTRFHRNIKNLNRLWFWRKASCYRHMGLSHCKTSNRTVTWGYCTAPKKIYFYWNWIVIERVKLLYYYITGYNKLKLWFTIEKQFNSRMAIGHHSTQNLLPLTPLFRYR